MAGLSPVTEKIILHWGEMGSLWGVNRAVAQIYARLYLSCEPLTAEEISETLGLARSTVSTGLRELQSWALVKVVHILGDRRDHFEALQDVWEMFRVIIRERKRREFDPTLSMLRQSVSELEEGDVEDPQVKERVKEMLSFFETVTTAYNQVEQLPTDVLTRMAESGDRFLGWILRMVVKE